MKSKYNCNICNYNTNSASNYNSHIKTKKHNKLKNTYCKYCKECFDDLKHHSERCKDKIIIEMEKRHDAEIKCIKNKYETKLAKQKKELIETIETEQLYFIKKLSLASDSEELMKNITDNEKENKKFYSKSVIINYVINNCKNAYNFDDVIEKPLTDDEKDIIINNDFYTALNRLINLRCIEKLDITKRPFHNLDEEENKIMLRINNKWVIPDSKSSIIDKTHLKISEILLTYISEQKNELVKKTQIETIKYKKN